MLWTLKDKLGWATRSKRIRDPKMHQKEGNRWNHRSSEGLLHIAVNRDTTWSASFQLTHNQGGRSPQQQSDFQKSKSNSLAKNCCKISLLKHSQTCSRHDGKVHRYSLRIDMICRYALIQPQSQTKVVEHESQKVVVAHCGTLKTQSPRRPQYLCAWIIHEIR